MEAEKRTIHAALFGGFCVSSEGSDKALFSASAAKERKVASLLEYLIVYRGRTVTAGQLIEALWPDEEERDTTRLLYDTVYRARRLLERCKIAGGRDLVCTVGSDYIWDPSCQLRVDTDEFEDCLETFGSAQSDALRFSAGKRAVELYSRGFLPDDAVSRWATAIRVYYEMAFTGLCEKYSELLLESGMLEEAVSVCERGISVNPTSEPLYVTLISSLIKQGNIDSALDYYNNATDMLLKQYFITPSEKLLGLYAEMTAGTLRAETDLSAILDRMEETDFSPGAYRCSYGGFRELYRIFARSITRTGYNVCVALVTLIGGDGEAIKKGMARLDKAIHVSLRSGDIYCRLSPSQFLVMLHSADFEDSEKVMARVARTFRQSNTRSKLLATWKIIPMRPKR